MATTTNFGWETPDDTDLVKDGALAIRTLGNSIDTSLVDLKGGTTGQVLSKTSNTDMDFTWVTSDDANAIQNAIVDAKGDLIAASAADTPARLAVGNNGETLVADSSQTTGLRYNPPVGSLANPVINGGFDIWQRGTSSAVTAAVSNFLLADRWWSYRAVSGATVSRQNVSDNTNLPTVQYSYRIQRDSGNTSTSNIWTVQNIETANSKPYAGRTITMSYYARSGANFSGGFLAASVFSGEGTDQNYINSYTGLTTVANTDQTITSTWTRYVITGTVPTTSTELAIRFLWTPSGTAGANDWVEITGVQIDLGTYTASSAPTFRRAGGTLAGELAACQRYYYRMNATSDSYTYYSGNGYAASTSLARAFIYNPVTMRTVPTVLDTNLLGIRQISNDTLYTSGTFSLLAPYPHLSVIGYNHGSAVFTTGNAVILTANNSTSSYIGLGAEL